MTAMLLVPHLDPRRHKGDRATSLGDIEIFAEVVDAGSMTGAAHRLGLSVPVISKRMQRLEAKLGVRLLERSTRRIALTEAGQGFHHRVGRILEAFDDAVGFASEVSTSLNGTLRVLAPAAFGRMHLAPHLPRFLETHPALHLDLELSDHDVDIATGGFHLALRVGQLADFIADRQEAGARTPGALRCTCLSRTVRHPAEHRRSRATRIAVTGTRMAPQLPRRVREHTRSQPAEDDLVRGDQGSRYKWRWDRPLANVEHLPGARGRPLEAAAACVPERGLRRGLRRLY